eukprot:g5749.t1
MVDIGSSDTVVKQGEWVLLQSNEQDRKVLVRALPTETCRLGKKYVSLKPIIGARYGGVLELRGKQLVPVDGPLQAIIEGAAANPTAPAPSITADGSDTGAGAGAGSAAAAAADAPPAAPASAAHPMPKADNRSLVDSNTAQRLSTGDIEALRESGASGEEIIRALTQSSDSWQGKTEFSKQKYLKRKAQKYLVRVRVTRCEASNIVATYFEKNAARVLGMREDALAQILALANVRAGARVLLFETCMGLVTGALAQRLGGSGQVMVAYAGQQAGDNALSRFNLPQSVLTRNVVSFPLSTTQMLGQTEAQIEAAQAAYSAAHPRMTKAECDTAAAERRQRYTPEQQAEFERKKAAREARRALRPPPAQVRAWLREGSDALVVASKYDPYEVVSRLLPLLKPSSPIVVYGQDMEPLVRCHGLLQRYRGTAAADGSRAAVIALQLSSCWYRDFQVLPNRTHPTMDMRACGGYLLSGIMVLEGARPADCPLVQAASRQRLNPSGSRRAGGFRKGKGKGGGGGGGGRSRGKGRGGGRPAKRGRHT